jgi:hypothetical protein
LAAGPACFRLQSVAPVSARRLDGDHFVEVEFVDGLQGFGSGAFLKIFGQGFEPGPVFGLQGDEGVDGVAPAWTRLRQSAARR